MPLNNTPPPASGLSSVANTSGTLQRANMDVPGKQNRAQNVKEVAGQPGAPKSSMQIDGADWGDSSNRNQYQGSPEGEQGEDQLVRSEKEDGFMPRRRDQLFASASALPDINALFQSLKTSGRKLIHFFVPATQSRNDF